MMPCSVYSCDPGYTGEGCCLRNVEHAETYTLGVRRCDLSTDMRPRKTRACEDFQRVPKARPARAAATGARSWDAVVARPAPVAATKPAERHLRTMSAASAAGLDSWTKCVDAWGRVGSPISHASQTTPLGLKSQSTASKESCLSINHSPFPSICMIAVNPTGVSKGTAKRKKTFRPGTREPVTHARRGPKRSSWV